MSVSPFATLSRGKALHLLTIIHRLQFHNLLLAAILLGSGPASARDMLPPGFVYLRDVDSSIQQDIRYATSDNFTGHPLPGYGSGECILRSEGGEALKRGQAVLTREDVGLKV